MNVSIFYSWQSDLPSKSNRYYIEDALKKAIKKINKDNRVISCLDRDTKDELGSPDIRSTIFSKINHSKFFVCDVSITESGTPNPNVLLELGYAIKSLGWEKIICLFNENTGKIEDLPFDINHNRVTPYNPDTQGTKTRIADIISLNLQNLFKNGALFNPIEDHLKKKIDYILLQILHNILNIFDFQQDIDYSKRMQELSALSINEIEELLIKNKTLGFYYLFDYEPFQEQLEQLLNQLLSCGYFIDGWRESVITFIDWIDMWKHTVDPHISPDLFKSISSSDYGIKDMHKENPSNSPGSVLLLKHLDNDYYRVVQGGYLSNWENADKIVCIRSEHKNLIARRIQEFFNYVDFWLDQSGNEFILDPHYYIVH